MRNITYFSSFIIIIIEVFITTYASSSFSQFECLNKKGNVPELLNAYTTDIRINFINEDYTTEMIYGKNNKGKKEYFHIWKSGRQVKYITRRDEGCTLFIEYQDNKQPTCEVIPSTDKKDFLKKEDTGKNNIILKALQVMLSPSEYSIYSTGPAEDTGVLAVRYEGCLKEPQINISMTFAAKNWRMSRASTSLKNNVNFPEMAVVQIGDNIFTAFYMNFEPYEPDDSVFDPPANVYCKGFRSKKKPPKMLDSFSYNSEMINYDVTKAGIVPLLSQRKVYNDYNDKISRIDFNDLLASDTDTLTKTTAQKKSIIHDYNSGVQYIVDSFTGKCSIDTFQETFNAFSYQQTTNNLMLYGDAFFWLDDVDVSYNGQFPLRGVMTDVYTALRIDPKTRNPYIISWYFSTETTQVAENENVEKNVLLSMSVRPETEFGKEKVTEIHFFDFVSEEPDVFNFDLTNCYNESSSKTLVFTFPAYDLLRGSEKLVGRLLNIAIKDITGVRKHRIYTKEVIFSGKYMYSEFSLLEDSPIRNDSSSKKISLDDALKKLQDSVKNGDFKVKVQTEDKTIMLKPEPNGLNVFAGDRPRTSEVEGYHQSSVISLTVGMLFLGFLLGTVSINLIMSKKYGVSLFQRSGKGSDELQHSLNESSM